MGDAAMRIGRIWSFGYRWAFTAIRDALDKLRPVAAVEPHCLFPRRVLHGVTPLSQAEIWRRKLGADLQSRLDKRYRT